MSQLLKENSDSHHRVWMSTIL